MLHGGRRRLGAARRRWNAGRRRWGLPWRWSGRARRFQRRGNAWRFHRRRVPGWRLRRWVPRLQRFPRLQWFSRLQQGLLRDRLLAGTASVGMAGVMDMAGAVLRLSRIIAILTWVAIGRAIRISIPTITATGWLCGPGLDCGDRPAADRSARLLCRARKPGQPRLRSVRSGGQRLRVAAAKSSPIYLFAFQDHNIRAAASYWVDGRTLHYVTLAARRKAGVARFPRSCADAATEPRAPGHRAAAVAETSISRIGGSPSALALYGFVLLHPACPFLHPVRCGPRFVRTTITRLRVGVVQ